MTIYYINLLIIFALAWPLCIYKPSKAKTILYLLITFGFMWFLAAFRYDIGYDYHTYLARFEAMAGENGYQAGREFGFEPGFVLVSVALSKIVSGPVGVYGAYTLLIFLPVMWFIFRHSKSPWLSTWMYVTLTFFYGTMNFIRQNMAASVLLMGYSLLVKNRCLKLPLPKSIPIGKLFGQGEENYFPIPLFWAVVLAASTFHKTALIMIPISLACQIKLDKVMGAVYAGVTLLLFMTSGPILDIVTNHIYTYYKGTYYITRGFTDLIFLMIPVMLLGACLALWPAWQKRDPAAKVHMNLILYNCIIWIFITRHFILERFSLFVYIFALVGVPSALGSLRCTDEEYEYLAMTKKEDAASKKKARSKEEQGKLRLLGQKIKDHEKYYWSAVVALLLLSLIYNEFGGQVNGFHGVFPYQSLLSWLP